TLQALKGENDHATITLDGQSIEVEQALIPANLVSASSYLINQDVKDNFWYENVQTMPSAIGGPVAFRARFKNILLPSGATPAIIPNIPYAPIPTGALNGPTPPNTTLIDPLDSTEKGLLIHTSVNGPGSSPLFPNLWEPTDNASFLASSFANNLGNATNTLTKELLAEDTFYGSTVNLGYLSRSPNSYIKATLVWTGVPGGGFGTDANLNLTLQGNNSGLTYTPSFLPLNTPSTLGGGWGFNGTDSVPGGTINAVDYIEQIFIPATDLNPWDTGYNVTVGGTLGSVSPNLGQDFSIFFSVTGVVGNGHGWGDVHLSTFDGKPYEFQTTGEFILVKSLIDDFQVQTRQEASPYWIGASVNTAFAINLGGYIINYDIDLAQDQRLSIDGQSYNLLSGETLDLGIGQIKRQGSQYTFTYAGLDGIINTNDDDLVTAFVYEDTINTSKYYININVNPADYRFGLLQGLLGNGDGITSNDFALRDGTNLQLNPGQWENNPIVHTTFADSWRVSQTESLFPATTKQTAAASSFASDIIIPPNPIFDPEALAAAFDLVNKAGVAAGQFQVGAVIDYLRTGDPSFINSAKQFGDFVLQDDNGVIQLGSIQGRKWNDANANGIWDEGEKALAGWTIYIDSFTNGKLDPWEISTVTNADGQYTFSNLGPGEYAILKVNQTGWIQTFPTIPYALNLTAGENLTGINFGNYFQLPTINLSPSNQTVVEGLTTPQNASYTVTLSQA
ncbi:MAG: SdrD B-like domain-containing protein, partial [Dolichospermum sp.]